MLNVQELVSRTYINQKLATIYGSNRTLDIGIAALMPMMIEFGVLERAKHGVYKIGTTRPILAHPAVVEIYIATDISLSGSKSITLDETSSRPWPCSFK